MPARIARDASGSSSASFLNSPTSSEARFGSQSFSANTRAAARSSSDALSASPVASDSFARATASLRSDAE